MKSLFVALVLAAGLVAQANMEAPLITVRGQGSVQAEADQVDLTITVTTVASTKALSLSNNNKSKAAVESAVTGLSLNAKDLKTNGPATNPNYDYTVNPAKRNGWVTVNTMTLCLKTKDFSRVGEVIDAAAEITGVTTGTPTYNSSKAEEYQRAARKLALLDAKEKAEEDAVTLGVQITGLDQVTEESYGGGRNVYAARAMSESADAGATTVNPAALTFSAAATVSFTHSVK